LSLITYFDTFLQKYSQPADANLLMHLTVSWEPAAVSRMSDCLPSSVMSKRLAAVHTVQGPLFCSNSYWSVAD